MPANPARRYNDFIRYLDDVEDGVYIQHTLDGILADADGKQLLVEATVGLYRWNAVCVSV